MTTASTATTRRSTAGKPNPDILAWEQELLAAKTKRELAEVKLLEQQARDVAATAHVAELHAEEMTRAAEFSNASDEHNHVYKFFGSVTSQSATQAIGVLSRWSRMHPGKPFTIVFNSPGGSVIDGMALFDHIIDLRSKGHRITTVARGMAASMGGVLLQAGDHRVMGAEAYVLIHELSAGTGGKIGEMEDMVTFYKKVCTRIVNIFAERSKLTAKQIDTRWKRTDWWLDSKECLEFGLVDEIA